MTKEISVTIVSVLFVLLGHNLHADTDELPSMEFLEYLGEWESSDGQWMDPVTIIELQENEMQVIKSANVTEEQSDE